jgi:hypothetical protein
MGKANSFRTYNIFSNKPGHVYGVHSWSMMLKQIQQIRVSRTPMKSPADSLFLVFSLSRLSALTIVGPTVGV